MAHFAISTCILYALCALLFPEIRRALEPILVLVTLLALAFGKRDHGLIVPVLLLLGAVAVSVTAWLASYSAEPYGFEPESAPRIDQIGKWYLFILLAFWLSGRKAAIFLFGAAAVAGFLATPWITGDGLGEFFDAFQNKRIDAGTMNAQHAAMLSGLLLILGLSFLLQGIRSKKTRLLSFVAGALTSIAALFMLYATQTRGVWISCFISVFVMLALTLSTRNSPGQSSLARLAVPIAAALIILAGLGTALNSNVMSRFESESGTLKLVLTGQVDTLPLDSTGIRVRTWHHSLPWISERFWFGWGPDGGKLIMQESDALPDDLKSRFGHLHNTYLEILAQYGFFGLALYLSTLLWLSILLIRAARNENIPYPVFIFGTGFICYWLTVNFFESYMFFSSGQYAFTIVLAGLLASRNSPSGPIKE